MRSTFADVSRSLHATTWTSGLSASIVRLAEALGRVDDLALQVRLVDDVRVDDPDPADAGCCKVERCGRAEPARADQQDFRVEQLQLPLLSDLGNQQMAAVACPARPVETGLQFDGKAVAFPVGEAA